MEGSEFEFFGRGLAGTVWGLWSRGILVRLDSSRARQSGDAINTYSEGTSAPWATTSDFTQVGQKGKRGLVAQRHVDDAVVSQGAHGRDSGAFLTSTKTGGRDEKPGHFAPVGASSPLATGLVPESFPLSGEVAVTGGDTEEEGVVRFKNFGFDERDRLVLTGGIHLGKNFLRKSFFNSM